MKLLESLTQTVSPSGAESLVAERIKNAITPYVTETYTDTMGNLIAHKQGSGKKIMLTAHMDEVGVMATFIDEKGFVRFSPIGWLPPFYTLYKKIIFTNGVTGVVGYEEENKELKDLKPDHLYIDIGAASRVEAQKMLPVGTAGGVERSFTQVGTRIFSGTLDNRAGCWCLIHTAMHYRGDADVFFVFTVQEEVGLRGAQPAAFLLRPDLAVNVDVTDVGDTPHCPPNAVELGGGPAIKVMDNTVMTHPALRRKLFACAQGLPYQTEVITQGGTDAGAIHTAVGGIMTGAVSIPCRYMHSTAESVDTRDLQNTVLLLTRFLEQA